MLYYVWCACACVWGSAGALVALVFSGANLLGRSKEAIRENTVASIVRKKAMKAKGRPALITDAKFKTILAATERMIQIADCRWEVTMDKIQRRVQFKGSLRTLADAFRSRGYYFRSFREKLRLTPRDVLDRKQFAEDYISRSEGAWLTNPHAIIDNKSYPVYLNGNARDNAARRVARGSYRLRTAEL